MNRFFGAIFGFVTAYTLFHFAIVIFSDEPSKASSSTAQHFGTSVGEKKTPAIGALNSTPNGGSRSEIGITTTASVKDAEDDAATIGQAFGHGTNPSLSLPTAQPSVHSNAQNTVSLPAQPIAGEPRSMTCSWKDLNASNLVSTPESLNSLADDGSVYRTGDRLWSEALENSFAAWVKNNFDSQFLERNHLSGFDSAQTAAMVRAIYARTVNLPTLFLAKRPVGLGRSSREAASSRSTGPAAEPGLGATPAQIQTVVHSPIEIGHFSKDWAALPTVKDWSGEHWKTALVNDQRFRAYLNALKSVINTTNIIYNMYPIALTDPQDSSRRSSFLREGVAVVGLSRVQLIRSMTESSDSSIGGLTHTNYPVELGRGVVSWRWVYNCNGKWSQVPAPSMPGFSMQQYQLPSEANLSAAQKRSQQLSDALRVREFAKKKLQADKTHVASSDSGKLQRLDFEISALKRQMALTQRTIALYRKDPKLQFQGTLASFLNRLVNTAVNPMSLAAAATKGSTASRGASPALLPVASAAVSPPASQALNRHVGSIVSPSSTQKFKDGLTQSLDQSSVR